MTLTSPAAASIDAPLPPVGLDELPSMPAAAATIVGLCDDPNVGLDELARAISLDPALSARILRLANSAAYSRGNEVTAIDRAMMTLGLKVVKLTALGFVVSSTLSAQLSPEPDLERQIWRQCLVEAVACRELAVLAGVRAASEAFLCGLFDGMGRLLGVMTRPETFGRLLAETPWPTQDDERSCLGRSVSELASSALGSWGVPDLYRNVLDAAAADHATFDASEVGRLSAVLVVARHACHQLLGDPYPATAQVIEAADSIGIDLAAIDTIAVDLGTHVHDLAATLDIDIGAALDFQLLLVQARDQIIATSMQLAQEAMMQSAQIQSLEQSQDELRRQATTDRLTGLPNRAAFDDFIRNAVNDRLAGRTQSGALGVAMIDIDRFKALNDTHGHRCGDRVLSVVGDQLARLTRAGEMIARYGGEEFVLVAPIVESPDGLLAMAERIRLAIAGLSIESDGLVLEVTVSIGAIGSRLLTSESAASSLTEAADRLLYQAKHAGRNASRVEWLNSQ